MTKVFNMYLLVSYDIKKRKKSGKYKYLYPLNNNIKKICEELKKPYPKNASIA